MQYIIQFVSDAFSFLYQYFYIQFFSWLPGSIGVPICTLVYASLILGCIKLIAFVLDCIPFY